MALLAGAGCGAPVQPQERETSPAVVRGERVKVVVLDGDLRRRVRHAHVWIGRRHLRANRRGVAVAVLPRRRGAVIRVSARGYSTVTRRANFRRSRAVTVRVYQPRLQWPMYGANPARTGAQTALHLRPPFRTLWVAKNENLIEFPAVVSDGFAYIGNAHGTVRAISMRHGTIAWRRNTRSHMASSPGVWRDKLIVHSMGSGHVRVLDRRNGRIVTDIRIGSPIESSPVVRYGIDYFGTASGRVYAFDLRRRRFRWIFGGGYKITGSVALSGATAYVGDYGGRVLALNTRNGRLRWSGSVGGRIYGTAAVAGGRVFVPSSTGGSLTAFSTRGARLWSFHTGSYVYSTPATWAGRVVFGSYNGLLYCVSAASGRLLWSHSLGGAISGAAVIVDGVAYAASFANRTVGVDVRTGRVVFRFPHGDYVPVSGNGGRLLLHGYSRLWAVEPRRR